MKKFLITAVLVLSGFIATAQESSEKVKKGDVYEIVKPSGFDFKYIKFPKKNFIIKQGGIVSDKLVEGKKVTVTKVTTDKDGSTKITIKPTDGGRFYNALSYVTVDYEKAMNSMEIKKHR